MIHADIDPAEISKNRVADVPIVGDLAEVLAELNVALRGEGRRDLTEWVHYLDGLRSRYEAKQYPATQDDLLRPEYVIKRLGELAGPDATYVAGVGPASDVGCAPAPARAPGTLLQLRRCRHDGLLRSGRDGREGRPARPDGVGQSTATAASR